MAEVGAISLHYLRLPIVDGRVCVWQAQGTETDAEASGDACRLIGFLFSHTSNIIRTDDIHNYIKNNSNSKKNVDTCKKIFKSRCTHISKITVYNGALLCVVVAAVAAFVAAAGVAVTAAVVA